VIKLQRILVDWINDELAEQRIIVQQLDEDMYDGQVLHKLWEKLTGKKLDVPEVTQSEQGQHEKLNIVLKAVNHVSVLALLKIPREGNLPINNTFTCTHIFADCLENILSTNLPSLKIIFWGNI